MKKKIEFLIPVLWMILIFAFSQQDGTASTKTSLETGRWIGHIFCPGFEQMTEEEQESYAENIELFVRKGAHASEYAILAVLWMIALKKRAFMAWGITVCYAATDEFHQLFIPGREGKITDVGIDAGGALLGLLLFILVAHGIGKIRRTKTS